MADTKLPVDESTTWWCLKAGRGGILEDDWLDQQIVTTGWGDGADDFRNVEPEEFQASDPSPQNQLSKFIGYDDKGIERVMSSSRMHPRRGTSPGWAKSERYGTTRTALGGT